MDGLARRPEIEGDGSYEKVESELSVRFRTDVNETLRTKDYTTSPAYQPSSYAQAWRSGKNPSNGRNRHCRICRTDARRSDRRALVFSLRRPVARSVGKPAYRGRQRDAERNKWATGFFVAVLR